MPPTRRELKAIAIIRQEILIRDGLDCVPCRILGRCKECKLLSATLNPVTYFRLDSLRTNAGFRLQLGHLHGKKHENHRELCAQCPCHNERMTAKIREVCLEYTAQMPERGTERFEDALRRRPGERAERKERHAKVRHAIYEKNVERLEKEGRSRRFRKGAPSQTHRGKEPAPPKVKVLRLPSKTLEQMARPVLNG